MKRHVASGICLVFLAAMFFASSASAQLSAKLGDRVANWTRPMELTKEADKTPPRVFVGVDPCRIVDTRGPAGPYGAPALTGGVPRNFALQAGPCAGLPATIDAYSLNITVVNTLGPGFILIYPQGGAQPTVSTLNYVAGQVVANAAIVPAGAGAGVTVIAGVSGTDLIIDINGYFSSVLGTPSNYFSLDTNSGGFTMFLRNLSTSCGGTCGIYQEVNGTGGTTAIDGVSNGAGVGVGVRGETSGTGNGAAGVIGQAFGTTGRTFGVFGQSLSTGSDSAGIKGLDSTGGAGVSGITGHITAGVRGESHNNIGVYGLANYAAVVGELYNTAGGFIASGWLGSAFGTASDATGPPWGLFSIGNLGVSGAKHFVEPHPSDASKVIVYTAIEGRSADTYFRGTAQVVNHEAVIEIPEDFRIVTDDVGLTVQLTPMRSFASMYIESQDLNRIVVKSSRDVAFHYLVQGVRRAFKDVQPVRDGNEYMPMSATARMPTAFPEDTRRRLIANGTYNEDGTVNMRTAERAGWTKIWAERAQAATEAANRDPGRQGSQ